MSLAPPQAGPPPVPPFARPAAAPYAIPETRPIDKTRQAMAGIGAGLAGIQGPGRFASFARGAGQSMVGGEKNEQEQTKDNRAAQGQHFNQLSTSFKDMMLAQSTASAAATHAAQARFFDARATGAVGGGASGAYQRTPEYQIMTIDKGINTSLDKVKSQLLAGAKQWGWTEEQYNLKIQAAEQKAEASRQAAYQKLGLDPNKVARIKSAGMTQDNPIDTTHMSQRDFDLQVPMSVIGGDGKLIGGWYKNPNGDLHQRIKGPEGQPQPAAENASDDRLAANMASGQEERTPESAPAG